eukprot:scaffold3274_cov244-Pinguiococcus_pyrenoidosus.AAC.1
MAWRSAHSARPFGFTFAHSALRGRQSECQHHRGRGAAEDGAGDQAELAHGADLRHHAAADRALARTGGVPVRYARVLALARGETTIAHKSCFEDASSRARRRKRDPSGRRPCTRRRARAD